MSWANGALTAVFNCVLFDPDHFESLNKPTLLFLNLMRKGCLREAVFLIRIQLIIGNVGVLNVLVSCIQYIRRLSNLHVSSHWRFPLPTHLCFHSIPLYSTLLHSTSLWIGFLYKVWSGFILYRIWIKIKTYKLPPSLLGRMDIIRGNVLHHKIYLHVLCH